MISVMPAVPTMQPTRKPAKKVGLNIKFVALKCPRTFWEVVKYVFFNQYSARRRRQALQSIPTPVSNKFS